MATSGIGQSPSSCQSLTPSADSVRQRRREFRDGVRQARLTNSEPTTVASREASTNEEPPQSSYTSLGLHSLRHESKLVGSTSPSPRLSPSIPPWRTPAPSSTSTSTVSRMSESSESKYSTPGPSVHEQRQSGSAEEDSRGDGVSLREMADIEEGEIFENSAESEVQGPDIDVARPTGQPLRIGQSPPKKRPWRMIEGRPQPSKDCQCPIAEECEHMPADRLDCRTYAPIPKRPRKASKFLSFRKVNLERIDRHAYSDILAFDRHQQKIQKCPLHQLTAVQIPLRIWIEKMRFFKMDPLHCDQSFIIHRLRLLISFGKRNPDRLPADIAEDLTYLKRKWRAHIWDPDPLRGIIIRRNERITPTAGVSISRRLDPDYEFRKTADHFGHGGLVNGQCWPNQICMVRDRAHGHIEGGIAGDREHGARSVVLSNPSQRDDYADQDFGKTVHFVGTSRDDRVDDEGRFVDRDDCEGALRRATRATDVLFASTLTDRPVRLFRSFRLPEINAWRPRDGFRYDGLYLVRKAQRLDGDRAVYRFKLERMEGQNPIRLDRPSRREMEEFARLRDQQKSARWGD